MKFTDLINARIGWFYFNITYLQSVKNPLLNLEHENTAIKCKILLSISCFNKKCFTAVSNDWLILDKLDCFEVHSNLNLDIKYSIN